MAASPVKPCKLVSMSFHPGELAVQDRAGLREQAAPLEGMRGPRMEGAHAWFLAQQPWLVLGAADAEDRMWAAVLYGSPGFLAARDATTLEVRARPSAGDALAGALGSPRAFGALALEPATRRRMRLNGRAAPIGEHGLLLALEEVYGNCPKYIATREVTGVAEPSGAPARSSTGLDAAQRALLTAADTAFLATRAPAGVDASHRGGRPGFLQVTEEGRVLVPDYQGNAMFNSLGNLELDPAMGLTVVDFGTGTTLQLSGRARVVWDAGTSRHVELDVEAVVELPEAAPLRWELLRPARNPPLP